MDILQGLNKEQLKAVTHDEGPMLLVAGAGTGKTQVITRRIAWLVNEGKAKPEEILALTFTEKAAREMADRLHDLMGWKALQVPILTFNAFGAELLGRFATHIGRAVRGGLINDVQKVMLLKQRVGELQFDYYSTQCDLYGFCEGLIKYFGKLQNAGVTAKEYKEFVESLTTGEDWTAPDISEQKDLSKAYDLYEQIKLETGTYDYNDQLAIPLELLRQRPNLGLRLAKQYRYVLVDEYQDTSPVQDELLRCFLPQNANLFVVGDDDQAIYSFRGADIENILRFTQHYKAATSDVLVQNYRSGQQILDAAYRLITNNNPERLESMLGLSKRLHSNLGEAKAEFVAYANAQEELMGVADEISRLLKGGRGAKEIAVLARSNGVLKSLAKLLKQKSIAFSISSEVDVFQQRELINLWLLMEWLAHKASPEAVTQVMLGPFFGWSAKDCRRMVVRVKNDLTDPESALRSMAEEGDDLAGVAVGNIDRWRGWASDVPVSQLAYKLVFDTGLADRLIGQAENNGRIVRVFEDLQLFLGQMADYEVVANDTSLTGYMAEFPRHPTLETSELIGDTDGVQLLTVHASKGLEFEQVFVVGCTTKAWSSRSNSASLDLPKQLRPESGLPPEHEQRRLMYVAATRAKRRLVLSAGVATAGGQRQSVSPLVEELLGEVRVKPLLDSKIASVAQSVEKLRRYYPLESSAAEVNLPFEKSDGYFELSVGALALYDRCPYEFFLQHVLGISEPFGPHLAFGSVIHQVVQSYYEAKLRGEIAGADALMARVDELWTDRGYDDQAAALASKQRVADTIKKFLEREAVSEDKILGTEVKLLLDIPEAKLRLRGRMDAYFETDDGVEIRDYKTGLKKDPAKIEKAAKESFQLRTYALAYREMNGQLPARVTLDYLVTGVEGSAVLSELIIKNHHQKLIKLAEGIRRREFAPSAKSEYHNCAAFKYSGEPDEDE
jgi:DNA helicase-2/ATP-dependent DNA helicase PcrA